jgi:hypothetical protein
VKTLSTFLAGTITALCLGCGGSGPPPPETQDSSAYALRIKRTIVEFVAEGKQNPTAAPKEAAVLVETLEVYKSQPVGEHEAVYAELLERCRQLSSASGADVRKKLDELAALANKLPGQIQN